MSLSSFLHMRRLCPLSPQTGSMIQEILQRPRSYGGSDLQHGMQRSRVRLHHTLLLQSSRCWRELACPFSSSTPARQLHWVFQHDAPSSAIHLLLLMHNGHLFACCWSSSTWNSHHISSARREFHPYNSSAHCTFTACTCRFCSKRFEVGCRSLSHM